MKRVFTVTYIVEDEIKDEESREIHVMDEETILSYGLSAVTDSFGFGFTKKEFEKLEVDGELLFSKTGDAPERVKKLQQYRLALQKIGIAQNTDDKIYVE